MDEPTSGLDARAAAIVMRTVRNTVNTGRTVVCTIHQPSIDIFEAFDELLLLKRGGQIIFSGPLGRNSHKVVEYFEDGTHEFQGDTDSLAEAYELILLGFLNHKFCMVSEIERNYCGLSTLSAVGGKPASGGGPAKY